ncbi:MAG: DUF4369 domain-containing protein, partial [Bacteroidota bacterium]
MRKFIYLSLAVALFAGFTTSCDNKTETKDNFKLSIDVTNGEDNMIILSKREGGEMLPKDSVMLVDGKGTISGNIDLPEFYYLMFKNTRTNVPVFVDAGDIIVNIDMN